jgi:hypothetical protein
MVLGGSEQSFRSELAVRICVGLAAARPLSIREIPMPKKAGAPKRSAKGGPGTTMTLFEQTNAGTDPRWKSGAGGRAASDHCT